MRVSAGTNYAISFLLLHHFGFALATKQPSVTAATFAGIVRTTHGSARLERLAQFISRITRSQLASAAGNLLAVCLGSIVFARLWALLFSRSYLTISSAEHVYETLDPLASGTMLFAALTGVILWISALAGGWFENFATFNHVPEAIAHHPLGRRFGRERMKRLANTVDANLSSWTNSIVLGYLLGFVPAIGSFVGIPLDVRHVTLSTGTLALAAASFGRDWLYRGWFVYTLFGIAVTFVLNLGVSFSIAAAVAMKAYGVSRKDQLQLLRYTAASFLRSPRRFLIPPQRPGTRSLTMPIPRTVAKSRNPEATPASWKAGSFTFPVLETVSLTMDPLRVTTGKFGTNRRAEMTWKPLVSTAALLLASTACWAAEDGAALYKTKCSGCHGANGEGKPAIKAPALKGTTLDAKQIADHITKGEPTSKPPHNKGISGVSDEQATAIAQYIKTLK